MKSIHAYVCLLAISLTGTILASPVAAAPPAGSRVERRAIEALLASYTRCVTGHDEAGFRALLLDERIPFSSVQASPASDDPPDLRQYDGFRQAVFGSGDRYRQRFHDVRIEQHGPLAQVSLQFVTERLSGKHTSSTGWKVLHLVKIGDAWKIASELYTF